jgi:hypothetical protein
MAAAVQDASALCLGLSRVKSDRVDFIFSLNGVKRGLRVFDSGLRPTVREGVGSAWGVRAAGKLPTAKRPEERWEEEDVSGEDAGHGTRNACAPQ